MLESKTYIRDTSYPEVHSIQLGWKGQTSDRVRFYFAFLLKLESILGRCYFEKEMINSENISSFVGAFMCRQLCSNKNLLMNALQNFHWKDNGLLQSKLLILHTDLQMLLLKLVTRLPMTFGSKLNKRSN